VKGYETMNPASITPHIGAALKICKNRIMPGAPLRAKLIAENYMTDADLLIIFVVYKGEYRILSGKKDFWDGQRNGYATYVLFL
jgi:purine-nucleoside phosphorylase